MLNCTQFLHNPLFLKITFSDGHRKYRFVYIKNFISDTKQFKCSFCNQTYKFEGTLYKHLKCHDQSKAYCCQFCSKTIKTKFEFRKHLNTHSRRIQCDICNKSILGKLLLYIFNIYIDTIDSRQHRPRSYLLTSITYLFHYIKIKSS